MFALRDQNLTREEARNNEIYLNLRVVREKNVRKLLKRERENRRKVYYFCEGKTRSRSIFQRLFVARKADWKVSATATGLRESEGMDGLGGRWSVVCSNPRRLQVYEEIFAICFAVNYKGHSFRGCFRFQNV